MKVIRRIRAIQRNSRNDYESALLTLPKFMAEELNLVGKNAEIELKGKKIIITPITEESEE